MGANISTYEPLDNDYECNAMTTVDNPLLHRVHFNDETFDSFTLIWLDIQSKGNNLESLKTKNLLLEINKDCLFYDNCDLFFIDIDTMKFENKKILLIVSGSFVNMILSKPNIKNIISNVIIFCRYYYIYADLRNDFIVDICIDRKALKNSITFEISSLKLNLFENQPLKSVQTLTEDNNNINSGIYFKYILFIELLKQMPQTEKAKETMLKKSEDYYRARDKRLKEINEFRLTYTCDKAIKWYTRETFLYRLVNSAFRTEDITLWYIFRFYITDLCRQLEKVHQDQENKFGQRHLILYRGQPKISRKELEDIQSRTGCLVATTGFFSTSFERDVATKYILDAPSSDEYLPVVYEIIVDTAIARNIIFIDVVDYLSSTNELDRLATDEREVLFNIGSIFKITEVYYNQNENLWNIRMQGTDEGINSIKQQIKLIVNKFQIQNMNLLFGQHILNMGYYSAADSYFQQMLKELPKYYKNQALIYDFIGDMKMRVTNWNEALRNFNYAYMLKKKAYRRKSPNFGITLNHIGNYYRAIGNNNLALHFYRKSLKCVKDSFNIAITNLNIASILIINEQYLQAFEICHDCFYRLQQIEPCPNAQIVVCQSLMGDIHYAKEEYDDAEAFYINAFKIAKKFLFMDDRRLIKCIDALATIYQKQVDDNNKRAIEFCQVQLSLYQKDLPENHIAIAHILMILGKLSNTNDYYQKALTIFERNISQAYAPTANCLMLVAKYYDEQRFYEKALIFYGRAYEIQTKIYPANHSSIMDSEKLLNCIERKLKGQRLVN